MSSYKGKTLPEFSDDKQFEIFGLDLWGSRHTDGSATLYGRKGQAQHGVDVVIRDKDRVIGVQCKAVKQCDAKIIDTEVERAKNFTPALNELVVITTAPHDAKLVSHAQKITEQHKATGQFEVFYHGWDDLLRMLVDHQWVVHKHYPEFFMSLEQRALPKPTIFRLPLDNDLNITLSDQELSLFCSEASWGLKNDPNAILQIDRLEERRTTAMIAAIEATGTLNPKDRTQRSELRKVLEVYQPKVRRAEIAAKLLLVDKVVRSPWFSHDCWPETADTIRRLIPLAINGPRVVSGGLTVKIRVESHPKIVGYIDMDETDKAKFLERCPDFTPSYYDGGVCDLGPQLGLKYALPAGLTALVRYSTAHGVSLDKIMDDGAHSIYSWGLYPA